jgi:hypothetical protein
MADQRREPRWLTLRTGTIHGVSGSLDCAILDISVGGACLLLPTDARIDEAFALTTDFNGERYECRLAWQAGNRIGVAFQSRCVEAADIGLVPRLGEMGPAGRSKA